MTLSIEMKGGVFTATCFFLCSVAVLFLGGCLAKKIHYEIPPSHHALTNISKLHVEQFSGQNASFLKNILIQEIYKIPNFDYEEEYPEGDEHAAFISGEVSVYSVRDEKEDRRKTRVSLVQRDVVQRPSRESNRIRQRIFDFAEVPFKERAVHRTMDLDIQFTVTSAKTGRVLYTNKEKNSFQQSYIGEENILLMPLPQDEMERLGRQLIQRFLEKLNPSLSRKTLELETGTSPLPLTWGMADVGHPRILHGNRYAVAQEYEKALKIWNYVVFSPRGFKMKEQFVFTDDVFAQLKSAKFPQRVIQPLLELRNQTLTLQELDAILPKLVGPAHFRQYSLIVKSHARNTKNKDSLNLASAHYNLGAVYRLQNKLELAAYHFAQANAFAPGEKYAQAWTDVQHELGDFNPLDTMMDRTIEAASKMLPPPDSMIKIEKILIDFEKGDVAKEGYPKLEPVELEILDPNNSEAAAPTQLDSGTVPLDLN
ncbi:MAG: tetratricopeptide repeat protein [SAR324 cluster bacterium]|nr:tetratricopeptide repeat protein [SAR324 cluster bacterium]